MEHWSNVDRSMNSYLIDSPTDFIEMSTTANMTDISPGNSGDITNAETLYMTRVLVQRILVPVIVMIGLSGNIVSIAVLTNPSMKSSTNCYLTFLAIFDSLYLFTSFTLSFKHYDGIQDEYVYKCWYPYGRVLSDMWSNASVTLIVTFTVERYIVVCHPMRGRVICTPKRAKIIAIIMASSALVCTFPEFFEWKLVNTTNEYGNFSYAEIVITDFAEHESYSVGYYYFIAIVFTFIPLVALCSFNSVLIRSVCKANEVRKVMTHSVSLRSEHRRQSEQHKTTLMLVVVAVVFIICQLPSATLIIYNTYLDAYGINLNEYELNNLRIAGNVANILIQFNAAMNFILYSVMSVKFRRVFLRLFHRLIRGKNYEARYRESTHYSGMCYSNTTANHFINHDDLSPSKKKTNSTLFRQRFTDIPSPSISPCKVDDEFDEASESILLKDRILMKNGNVTIDYGTSL